MTSARAKRRVYAGILLAALLVAVLPFPACGSRAGACPGFDSCKDATTCPVVRCGCDIGPHTFPAKCGTDSTCFTASDCAALCQQVQGKCAKPPMTCDAYLATECQCGASKLRDAEAWNCVQGSQTPINAQDCVDACGTGSGGAGSGGAGPGVGGGFSSGGGSSFLVSAGAG